MIHVAKTTKPRELKLEAVLLFLSLFYFVIATNTQTGWLFVLSAFLLGVLLVSFILTRRGASSLELRQTWHGNPQRGRAFRVRFSLTNSGHKATKEILVESVHPSWAVEQQDFAWAIPLLEAGATATCEYRLTPIRRGEHRLPDANVICGAPFGLFPVRARYRSDTSFLVYPPINRLPSKKTRSRLATQLGELVSPQGLGDSRNLRSVREYRGGDDLRHVHWKASAKRSAGAPLLVKEHHSPAPSKTVVVLDNSVLPLERDLNQLFETAVGLATTILWSAHREGAQTVLLICDEEGRWTQSSRWPQQYRALAGIQPIATLNYQTWLESSQAYLPNIFPTRAYHFTPILLKAGDRTLPIGRWPTWAADVVLIVDPEHPGQYPTHPRLLCLDGTKSDFLEATSSV